jgi:hypothetical protein
VKPGGPGIVAFEKGRNPSGAGRDPSNMLFDATNRLPRLRLLGALHAAWIDGMRRETGPEHPFRFKSKVLGHKFADLGDPNTMKCLPLMGRLDAAIARLTVLAVEINQHRRFTWSRVCRTRSTGGVSPAAPVTSAFGTQIGSGSELGAVIAC